MKIVEYRVIMPMSVDEYERGQRWTFAEASKRNTGGGEGIEVLKNEIFSNYGTMKKGVYTYKIYHLKTKVPPFIRLLAPKGSLEIHEEAWNAFPHCKTNISNPTYMKERFYIKIDSIHLPGRGEEDNVHELPTQMLKIRKVVVIDIANDPLNASDYKNTEDPTKCRSKVANRGPLKKDWIKTCNPVMTAYKLVVVEFKWFGLQHRIESFIQKVEKRLFTTFHRNVFCWMDDWYKLSLKDVLEFENRIKKELDEQRNQGKVKGLTAEAED